MSLANKESLFARYKKERENAIVVEDEFGFASAKVVEDGLYIDEIYVIPEKRKEGIASKYADRLEEVAVELDYKKLYGSVCIDANKATDSLKVLLAYGFSLHHLSDNMIYLYKEI